MGNLQSQEVCVISYKISVYTIPKTKMYRRMLYVATVNFNLQCLNSKSAEWL